MSKKALILGIGGQDGSFLAEILLRRGYEVHGMVRRSSVDNMQRIKHLLSMITLHQGDITDFPSLLAVITENDYDEIYNEADQDSVSWSFSVPRQAVDVTYGGVVNLLEIVRGMGIRVFQPLSATMFGDSRPPQAEATRLAPMSPYAIAKTAAYYLCRFHRKTYGTHVVGCIFFNHDSPRRAGGYLLHKIADAAKTGGLLGGNTDQMVDIGYAEEYMEAAVDLMQLEKSDDYVLGTGKGYKIQELMDHALSITGKPIRIGPTDPNHTSCGDLIAYAHKVKAAIGWKPQHDAKSVLAMLLKEREEIS